MEDLIKLWEKRADRNEMRASDYYSTRTELAEMLTAEAYVYKLCADELRRKLKE